MSPVSFINFVSITSLRCCVCMCMYVSCTHTYIISCFLFCVFMCLMCVYVCECALLSLFVVAMHIAREPFTGT